MRRITIFLITVAAITFTITAVVTSKFSSDDKHTGHHQNINAQQKPQARVDGAVSPELIPDSAAYEILFHLLSSTLPEEKRELRKSAYLKGAGFSEAEAAAITNAAYEYKRQVEQFDDEVDSIKQANWPNPSSQVMSRLALLQKQKEAIIENIAGNLQSQIYRYSPLKLRNHITGEIKRHTKGFSAGLPTKNKISKLGDFFSSWFEVNAQGAGCDALVYLYNNVTVDMGSYMVYGTGSYSLPYNNCGHSVSLSTSLSGPMGAYATGGEGAYLSLEYGEDYLDGYFLSNTEGEGWCPVVLESFYIGSMANDATLAPFVKIRSASIPTGITSGNSADLSYEISGSISVRGLTGMVDVQSVGAVNIQHSISLQSSYTVGGGVNTQPLGVITLNNGANLGSLTIQVSFQNCTAPTGSPAGTTLDGGCTKETNAMAVTKP